MEVEGSQQQQLLPQVVVLPSPGMGHLISLTEFAKQVVVHHNLSVTIVTVSTDSYDQRAQNSILDALPNAITSIPLPPISSHDFPKNSKIETQISLTIQRSLPFLRDVFKTLSSTARIAALVVDLFGSDAFDVAAEFDVPPYLFMTSNFMLLSLCLHLPTFDSTCSCEYRDLPEPVKRPGCVPISGKDMPDPFQDRTDPAHTWVLHHFKRFKQQAKGVLGNSFLDLEPRVIKALKEEVGYPPIYPVGPLIRSASSDGDHPCLRWLDEQPRGSVLYVSFGSGGTHSREQLSELAWGLEKSGQRFLWVVRSPDEKEAGGTFFGVRRSGSGGEFEEEEEEARYEFLPDGYRERNKGKGLVVESWAPQLRVLSHESTGGFLSHCGWNSTLESMVHGVPMIAWPLYAEQKMNAVMLAEKDLKVAIRARVTESSGLVRREEIANVVKGLMLGEEGKGLRQRMQQLKEASCRALAQDGSSYIALSEVAHSWKHSSCSPAPNC